MTELRSRLEDLEKEGYGQHIVDVSPAPPSCDIWPKKVIEEKRCRINFVLMDYVVNSVSLDPPSNSPRVRLTFIEDGKVPRDLLPDDEEFFAFASC